MESQEYFDIFMLRGPWPVAIAPGPNGELWFSACENAIRQPCEIGYYTRTLRQVVVVRNTSYVQSLVYGPDHNMWFASSPTVGYVNRAGHLTKYWLRSLEPDTQIDNIFDGPGGRLWFTDGGAISSVTTAGVARAYTTGSDISHAPLAGPDGRIYFTGESPDSEIQPICALAVSGVVTCFRAPVGHAPLPFSTFYPLLIYRHRVMVRATGQGLFGLLLMDGTGRFKRLMDRGQYTPLVETNNGDLAGAPGDGGNPSFVIAHRTQSGFVNRVYRLSESDIRYECYVFDHIVSTSDGYLWLLGHGADGGRSCLMRFKEQT